MTSDVKHPMAIDGKNPNNLRGDPIPQHRYYSREFMAREWEQLWTKVWHIGGRVNQLADPGDFIVTTSCMNPSLLPGSKMAP